MKELADLNEGMKSLDLYHIISAALCQHILSQTAEEPRLVVEKRNCNKVDTNFNIQ
jgi:hypothetical protein